MFYLNTPKYTAVADSVQGADRQRPPDTERAGACGRSSCSNEMLSLDNGSAIVL